MENAVNERIILLKNKLNLSDIEFCAKAEISTGTLQKIKSNGTISAKIINAISIAFNVSRIWLTDGTGEMFEPVKEAFHGTNPWKDALIEEMKSEIEFLKQLLLNLSGKASANFNDAFDLASLLNQKSIESVRVAA